MPQPRRTVRRAALALLGLLAGAVVVATPAQAVTAPGGAFHPLTPARLMDTRTGLGGSTRISAGSTAALQVAGQGGVPSTGVSAVAVNVTVVNPAGTGYATVFPTGQTRPLASTLNFRAGATVPNLSFATLGSQGKISVYLNGSAADVVVDVTGWFSTPGTTTGTEGLLQPLAPARLLDTRESFGGSTIAAGGTLDLQVSGRAGVPDDAAGVVVNATIAGAGGPGYLTVWPTGATRPTASNLNYVAKQLVANRVAVGLGTDGKVSLYNGSGKPLQVVVDVGGWFTSDISDATGAGYYNALTPVRAFDSRVTPPRLGTAPRSVQLTGDNGVPATDVVAVVVNATVTKPSSAGYLTVYPQAPAPLASDLNFTPNLTVANLTVAKVSDAGAVLMRNSAGLLDGLLDVAGYFVAAPADPAAPVITTSSLTAGTVGTPYSATLQATGGTTPYTWSVLSGSLPSGLSLSTGGSLTGTPTASGTSQFTVEVAGADDATDAQQLSLTINPSGGGSGPTITTSSLPDAVRDTDYSQSLSATGGTTPYFWEVADGSLPDGIFLGSDGTLGGFATTTGTSSFTVRVTDDNFVEATKALSITVVAFTVTTASPLPAGTLGAPYSTSLATSNGQAPVTFEVTSGALPDGLSLSTSGSITGTPTGTGTASFTVTATDARPLTASKAFTLAVASSPTPIVTTTALPGGQVGSPYGFSLEATGGTGAYTWSVATGTLPTGITLSPQGVLSGTPSGTANASVTFRVADAGANTGDKALALAVTASSGWPMPNRDVGQTGSAPQETSATATNADQLHLVWSVDASSDATAIVDGVLYTAGTVANEPDQPALTAYDVTNGTVLWQQILPCGGGGVSVTATAVVLPCNGKMRAYSRTGDHGLLWDTSEAEPSAGVFDYVVMSDRVVAIDSTAVYSWRLSDGARLWRVLLPETVTASQVAVSGTTAVVATTDKLRTYSTGTGAAGWSITAAPTSVIVDGGAVYSAYGGELHKLALANGASVWATDSGQFVRSVLGGDGTKVIVLWEEDSEFGPSTKTQAYTEATGALAWEVSTPTRARHVAVTPSLVWLTWADTGGFVGSDSGGVQAYRISDGSYVRDLDTGRRDFTPTAVSAGRLAVARSSSLRVYGFDPTPPAIETLVLRSGHVGAAYTDQLSATGGTGDYTWSLASGSLPSGISLSSSGTLSGTPSGVASPRVVARVTDAKGVTATRAFTVQISATGSGSWPTVAGNDARTGLAATETVIGLDGVAQLDERWNSAAAVNGQGGDLAVAGGKAYVSVDQTGQIHAYSTTSGATSGRTPLWTAVTDENSPGSNDLIQTGITISGNRMLVGTIQGLYSFDATTGAKQWRTTYLSANPGGAAPLVIGSLVFVGTGDGEIHAYDLATGDPAWDAPFTPDAFVGIGNSVKGLSTDGTRLFAAAGCTLYALTPATGATAWKKAIAPSGDAACASFSTESVPLVSGGVVYAGSYGGTMAFSASTGDVVWARSYGSSGSMALSNGVLVLNRQVPNSNGGYDQGLHAVDATTGTALWTAAFTSATPGRVVVAGDLVLSPAFDALNGFDLRTGDRVWFSTPINQVTTYPYQPAVANGMIYAVGQDKKLHAYGPP